MNTMTKQALKKIDQRTSRTEQQRQALAAAMPDVRDVVKKHGLVAVRSCVNKLHEFDKKEQEAKKLREEADAISRKLNDEADELERKLEQQRKARLTG